MAMTQDESILSRVFDSEVILCSKARALLYVTLNLRGPATFVNDDNQKMSTSTKTDLGH
jgi:hypothetical protein